MQGLKQHMSQINEASAAPPAAPAEGEEGGYFRARVTRAPDRRHQHKWVPVTTGWLCLLIGLADVIGVAIPSLHLHYRLHRITPFVPGTMTNVTSSVNTPRADVSRLNRSARASGTNWTGPETPTRP